jgi:hypothetical protein
MWTPEVNQNIRCHELWVQYGAMTVAKSHLFIPRQKEQSNGEQSAFQ